MLRRRTESLLDFFLILKKVFKTIEKRIVTLFTRLTQAIVNGKMLRDPSYIDLRHFFSQSFESSIQVLSVIEIFYPRLKLFQIMLCFLRQRPYHVENTGSRPITEVKQHRA